MNKATSLFKEVEHNFRLKGEFSQESLLGGSLRVQFTSVNYQPSILKALEAATYETAERWLGKGILKELPEIRVIYPNTLEIEMKGADKEV